jgi:N-acetyl-anhydromuramyl-L-alanine amidase AmpD
MKITESLLTTGNGLAVGDTTIGALIAAAGKEHLWEERQGSFVDVIVVHYTSAVAVSPSAPYNRGAVMKLFCDYGVSSHYLVDREGNIDRLAPEEKKAWHAGGSIMPGPDNRRGVNDFSIGIELMATADSGFTEEQYRSLSQLCGDIERRHGRRFIYVGHDAIAGERAVALGLRKEKKTDPGERFDWGFFLQQLGEVRQERPPEPV